MLFINSFYLFFLPFQFNLCAFIYFYFIYNLINIFILFHFIYLFKDKQLSRLWTTECCVQGVPQQGANNKWKNQFYEFIIQIFMWTNWIATVYIFYFLFCIYFGSFGPWVIGEPITQITLSVKAKFEFLMTKCCL